MWRGGLFWHILTAVWPWGHLAWLMSLSKPYAQLFPHPPSSPLSPSEAFYCVGRCVFSLTVCVLIGIRTWASFADAVKVDAWTLTSRSVLAGGLVQRLLLNLLFAFLMFLKVHQRTLCSSWIYILAITAINVVEFRTQPCMWIMFLHAWNTLMRDYFISTE